MVPWRIKIVKDKNEELSGQVVKSFVTGARNQSRKLVCSNLRFKVIDGVDSDDDYDGDDVESRDDHDEGKISFWKWWQ